MLTLLEVADILDQMADGDGYAVVENEKEIEALRLAAEYIRAHKEAEEKP